MKYSLAGTGICLFLQLFAGCVGNATLSGAGGQTTNGLTVAVVYPGGNKAGAGCAVRVRPADYLAEINGVQEGSRHSVVNGTTDAAGVFSVDSLDKGSYIIEVNDGRGFAASFEHHTVDSGGIIDAGTDTLMRTGAVRGYVPPEERSGKSWYIQVYGLERISAVDGLSGIFAFSDLPAGPCIFRRISSDSTVAPIDIKGIRVKSNETTILPTYPEWHYNAILTLNTTASGANIQGNVLGFPVLVRLTAGNFDFSLSKNGGADIRFAKTDGSPLPYEIAQWDSVKAQAAIWVKIDTVFGNDNRQINIYWGNPVESSQSKGSSVFDSASGFEGVWHLGETSGPSASDASPNGFSGIYKGGLPKNESSPLGICQNIMRPDSDYVDMGNVLDLGVKNVSIGIWVKRASFGTQQAMIAKTNGDAPSADYGYLFSIDLFNYPHFYMASGGKNFGDNGVFDVTSNLTITDSATWHYLFVAVDRSDNTRCKMYMDGLDRTGTMRGNVSLVADVANLYHLRLGTESDGNYSYKGAIAEVTIAFAARSADWVKLSYMNQKEPDALVKW